MDVVPLAPDRLASVCDETERRAPGMDFADACIVGLARGYERAFVLTADFLDFFDLSRPVRLAGRSFPRLSGITGSRA